MRGDLSSKDDDIVKSPLAALRFLLRHCDVRPGISHSSGVARLASGAFYFVVELMIFAGSAKMTTS